GPDGRVWFTERLGNKVAALGPNGTITEFPIQTAACQPAGIVTAPSQDGPPALRVTEQAAGKIGPGREDGTGMLGVPTTTASSPTGLTVDTTSTNGGVWFIHSATKIGHADKVGTIQEFPISIDPPGLTAITFGPDNNLWVTANAAGKILRISTAGAV